MSRSILVTCATGNQGSAVIDALVNHPDFTLLAQTRDASGPGVERLKAKGNNIKVVQGDQNNVPALFKAATEAFGGPIWGVFSVQISMGKGVTHDGEIRQGKAMVHEAIKAGVKHFVYSSVDRGGNELSWTNPTPIPHFASKYEIEHYLRDNAGPMPWTVLRPVAFMDNLQPGFASQVFVTALRDTLGPKPLQWIAVADIGIFVKLVFESPSSFSGKALSLAGDELTSHQLSQAFKNTTGQPLDGTYWFFGRILKYMVGELGTMIDWFASNGYKANIPELKKLHPGLLNMEAWIENKSKFPSIKP